MNMKELQRRAGILKEGWTDDDGDEDELYAIHREQLAPLFTMMGKAFQQAETTDDIFSLLSGSGLSLGETGVAMEILKASINIMEQG